MGFSLGDPFPHLLENGDVVWIKIKSQKQATWAEEDVRKHHRELAGKNVKIVSGVNKTAVANIKARPYWALALERVMNDQRQVDKIINYSLKKVGFK